jgi:hypothetical protein
MEMKYSKRHYEKLLSITKNVYGVKVKERKDLWLISSSNCWAGNQSIELGIYAECWYELIAVLAHELGHCLSVRSGKAISMATYMIYIHEVPLSKREAKLILEEERRAWRLGFKVLRDNDIEVDGRMLKFRNARMRGHAKTVKRLSA